ncbi:hypothetical protein [Propionivibrio sp.]|uniref:hypothetical protein n=1 Tax=Propionivibrio sp. TaxID=2212460 RepID=UPI003BF2FF88
MAAKPKLTPEQWAEVRAAWESDPREGYSWLVEQLGLAVSVPGVRKTALKEGWKKPGGGASESFFPGLPKVSPKVSHGAKKPSEKPSKKPCETMQGEAVIKHVIESTVGRPTKYKPEFAERAYKLCLLGMTDSELANHFEVCESTIYEWKNGFPEFSESLTSGKEDADGNVARSLYQRATGYSHPDVSVNVVNGEVILTNLTKHYPPETGAAKLWLINRQPRKWKDRVEIKEDINLNVFPEREVLDAIYSKALETAASRDAFLAGRRERLGIVIESGSIDD